MLLLLLSSLLEIYFKDMGSVSWYSTSIPCFVASFGDPSFAYALYLRIQNLTHLGICSYYFISQKTKMKRELFKGRVSGDDILVSDSRLFSNHIGPKAAFTCDFLLHQMFSRS